MKLRHTLLILLMIPFVLFAQKDVSMIYGKVIDNKNNVIELVNIAVMALNGSAVWAVHCHRVTMGKTPDKHVYLDYMTLGFVQYKEI